MNIYQIAAAGIICVILALTVKKQSPEIALVISAAGSIMIFLMIIPKVASVFDMVDYLSSTFESSLPYVSTVIKIIGVSYIAQFGSQICADAGESAIASKIELAGKVIIMAISAPVLITLLELVLAILA